MPTDPDVRPSRTDAVATKPQALSDPGMEKLIPLRFVNLLQCPTCADAATYTTLLAAVQATNEVFKAAGMQFAMRSVERYYLSNFTDFRSSACSSPADNGETQRLWPNVFQELSQVFPAVPWNAWNDLVEKNNDLWLTSVETLYGKPEELVVWLSTKTSCGGGYWASYPQGGRHVMMNGSSLAGEPYKLPHELGHYFGLVHTFDPDTTRDPETNVARVNSDRWDLHFKPGTSGANPNVYYTSKTAAAADEASLRRIEIQTSYPGAGPDGGTVKVNTCSDNSGVVTCVLGAATQSVDGGISGYTETVTTGSAALKGMGFTFASGQGANVMSYLGDFGSGWSRALADSDIEMVRRHIRWDFELNASEANLIKPGVTMSGRRPQLGSWDVRNPDARLDFDGDGKRDFGVWVPPLTQGAFGQFIVLLSSQGYSTNVGQRIDVQFGKLGDIPVPADYTGDGKADVAVYQPGGGPLRGDVNDTTGYWRWCATAYTPASTTCGHDGPTPPLAWGSRDSVPLPGLDFDGQANDTEVAIYQPSTGYWFWQDVGVGWDWRQLGPAGSVPLPGLYDSDFKTDLAIYNPYTADFQLLRSEQSWNTLTTRAFGSGFVPQPTGSSADRSAPFPLGSMMRQHYVWFGGFPVLSPRRAFSLFDPTNGTWNTMWNPVSGGAIETCQWGIGRLDVPLPGIDRNGDGYSELAVYRGRDVASAGFVHLKNATPAAGCTGSQVSRSYTSVSRIRTRAVAVSDMTGDGKAEIIFVQPDTMTIYWATSESDYQTLVGPRVIGNQRAVFF